MSTETLTPTDEWLEKNHHTPAQEDQKTKARAYRKISLIEDLKNREEITPEQYQAGERFHRIWHGAHGADVRMDFGGLPYDPDYPAQEAMASDLRYARSVIRLVHIWRALEMFLIEEKPLTDIHQEVLRKSVSRPIARAAGLTLVSVGLDLLADAWGISQHARDRERADA